MPEEVRITVFIIAAVLIGVILLFVFLYKPIRKLYYHRHPKEYFYKEIMSIVKDRDLYLINDVQVRMQDGKSSSIDHLVGGDKYLYAINDCYCEGFLTASPSDQRWIYYRKDGTKEEIPSPLFSLNDTINRLSVQVHVGDECLIGIVLINDDCFLNAFQNGDKSILLVPRSKLKKVIEEYENKPVSPFTPEALRSFMHDIDELSRKEE